MAADIDGRPAEQVTLDFHHRHRRRMAMTSSQGREFLLDLEEAVALRDGDVLILDDDGRVEVIAKAEAVAEITAADEQTLVRLAWHLGNRHLPTEIHAHCLRILNDHVIVEMVLGLGGHVARKQMPFHPEGGAYDAAHGHDH